MDPRTLETRRIHYPGLGETVFLTRAPSGVEIALIPKPGFVTSTGWFGLRFGSVDVHFPGPDGQELRVPDGSAHFLEHKLFEGREEKVFDRFANIGADFNGGTGFRTTTYHFSSAGRFVDGLDILLDFVQHPLITEERVEKEKGIIEQEVRMYEYNPDLRGLFLLLEALYHKNLVRIPPGGTVEEVRRTTAQDLQACYDFFYCPDRLKLALAGDFDPEAMLGEVLARLDPPGAPSCTAPAISEPNDPRESWREISFSVTRPRVWMGWKDTPSVGLGPALLEHRILSSLVMELALGESTHRRQSLYDQGVLDDSFSVGHSADEDFGHALAGGTTDKPEEFVHAVSNALAEFLEEGPQPEDLERIRRATWGAMVGGLQAPGAAASEALSALLAGHDPLATAKVLEEVSVEAVQRRASALFDPARRAVAVLQPQ